MGAKFWFIVYSDGDAREHLKGAPQADAQDSRAFAERLFPGRAPDRIEDSDLAGADPRGNEVLAGVFPGVSIVAAAEIGIDKPSEIDSRFVDEARGRRMTLHAQHSVSDWSAFALWEDGRLVRSLSAAPDSGIVEDIGQHLPFEESFWSPREDIYGDAFPYGHPLELGEEALLHFLGFQYEGHPDNWLVDPLDLAMPAFRLARKRSWKFW